MLRTPPCCRSGTNKGRGFLLNDQIPKMIIKKSAKNMIFELFRTFKSPNFFRPSAEKNFSAFGRKKFFFGLRPKKIFGLRPKNFFWIEKILKEKIFLGPIYSNAFFHFYFSKCSWTDPNLKETIYTFLFTLWNVFLGTQFMFPSTVHNRRNS